MTTPAEPIDDSPPWLSIELASANTIRSWSYGSIKTPRLFDAKHRGFHRDGLYSENIFGPIRDFHCSCGKYFGEERVGTICDECGVQIRPRSVRSQRMGHIELPVPILHPWFWGGDTAPIELLLGFTHRDLKRLVARRRFIELDRPGLALGSNLHTAQDVRVDQANNLDGFLARSGANAVHALLERTHYVSLLGFLEEYLDYSENPAALPNPLEALFHGPGPLAEAVKQSRRLKPRIEMLRRVVRKGVIPGHAVLGALPVIPAGLRAGEVMPDGHVRADSITVRYQRIIRCCRSIQRCLDRAADAGGAWPSNDARRDLVRRERRLTAEIAGLFDELLKRGSSASRAIAVRDRRRRWPGKRVDFSARSVVVPDPTLRLFECRLPRKKVAAVFFEESLPVRLTRPDVDMCVEAEATKRPFIFSFRPMGESPGIVSLHSRFTDCHAIHVHPLMATTLDRSFAELAANVHLPLSIEAEKDCDRLSFPSAAFRDFITGEVKVRLAADAAVGCFYATWLSQVRETIRDKTASGNAVPGTIFKKTDELLVAWEYGRMHIHDLVQIRLAARQPLVRSETKLTDEAGGQVRVWTTVGRALLNSLLPPGSPFFDVPFHERNFRRILQVVLESRGVLAAELFVERACALGLRVLTRSGLSLSLPDLAPPANQRLLQLIKELSKVQKIYDRGIITDFERQMRIADTAQAGLEHIAKDHFENLISATETMPPLLAILAATGSFSPKQLMRLTGMIGTVWSPWSRKTPAPVLGSFRSGVDPLGYFQLAAAARRQRLVKLLKSKAPRRLQRRIATVLSDIVVTDENCGTREGTSIVRSADEPASDAFAKRLVGRVILHNVYDTSNLDGIVGPNQVISRSAAEKIEACDITQVSVRSPVMCRSPRGICRHCYGADPATGRLAELGALVGAKSAIAMGRTMRALHELQRPASDDPDRYGQLRASKGGVVTLRQLRVALNRKSQPFVVSAGGTLDLVENDAIVESIRVPHGADLHVATGGVAAPGDLLATWNPRQASIFATASGVVRIERCGPDGQAWFLQVFDSGGAVLDGFFLPADAKILVNDGACVDVGALLATYYLRYWLWSHELSERFKRLKRLLQLRPPRHRALVAKFDGRIELKFVAGQTHGQILLHPTHGGRPLQLAVPFHPHRTFVVRTGQFVHAGDPLTTGTIFYGDLIATRGVELVSSLVLAEVRAILAELGDAQPGDERPWELFIAQMLKYVRIESNGDTFLKVGDVMPRWYVLALNRELRKKVKVDMRAFPVRLESGVISREALQEAELRRSEANPGTPAPAVMLPWPAGWSPLVLGVDELALQGSFLTSAGFVPSRKGLVRAALNRHRQRIERVQESVIAGQLMAAGSGWNRCPSP